MKEFLLAFVILAHSWYPAECCSDKDCFPVECNKITETQYGLRYQDKEIRKEQVKPSQDELCHVCINNSNLRCMFIPRNSV